MSAKAFSDKNASTLRILDLAVAKTELASVESVAQQLLLPRGRFHQNGSKEDCAVLDKPKARTVCEGCATVLSCV